MLNPAAVPVNPVPAPENDELALIVVPESAPVNWPPVVGK